jgi:pyrroloquinoline quinone (PQQ) biosynthesis protein C
VLEARAESDQRHAAEMKTMLTAFEREQAQQQQQLFQRIEAAWRLEDGLKTRALYAVLEKPVAGQSGQ